MIIYFKTEKALNQDDLEEKLQINFKIKYSESLNHSIKVILKNLLKH
jgi:hypothetical protein